jgi:PIN domain nuclease of toxin-antitoxin system
VAEIKIAHPALSLGDCYAVGLSEWLKGTLVTSDKQFSAASAYAKIKQIR